MKKFITIVSLFFVVTFLSGCTNEDVGMTTGALAGGVIGSQFGGGTGKTAATIGGTVAGGWVGREVGKNWD